MILSDDHIRSIIKEALKFRKPRAGSSGRFKSSSESVNIDVPDGDYIHPIVKNQDGRTPIFTSDPDPARKNPVDGKVRSHNGYDIGMPIGYPIVSVASGTVAVIKRGSKSAGNYIVVNHEGPIVGELDHTAYMHLSEILVKKGQKVKQGELIGKSGNTGRSTGPHLHFQIGKGSNSTKHSSDKAQYDAFFAKCKQASFSKGKLVADKEDSTSPGGSADKSSATSVQIVHKNASIKNGIDDTEYPALKAVVKDGKNKGTYLQIKDDQRTFKRIKPGAPVFKSARATFAIVKDNDEVKELIASA